MNDALARDILALGRAAREASKHLALATSAQKDEALDAMAAALRRRQNELIAANAQDMKAATDAGLSGAMLDRLKLDAGRIESMAKGIEVIRALKDPVGSEIS